MLCVFVPVSLINITCLSLHGNHLQFEETWKSVIYPKQTLKYTFKFYTTSVIHEPDSFAFQLECSPCAMKGWTRMNSLFGDFFPPLFSCQWSLRECTCPSQLSLWGLRGRNQGRRNNESSHRLQGIQTLPLSGGASSWNPHCSLSLKTTP